MYSYDEMVATLMARDNLSCKEVVERINSFRINSFKGALLFDEFDYDLDEAFMEAFELEPDYLLDIL